MRRLSWWVPVLLAILVPAGLIAGEDAKKAEVRQAVEDYLAQRGAGAAAEGGVTVGAGKLQISGLLQVWYNYNQNDNLDIYQAPNEANDNDTFRIRRAEIALNGQITPEVSYRLMVDAARGAERIFQTDYDNDAIVMGSKAEYTSSILQDAYINLNFIKWHTIRVGQMKRPLGREANFDNGKLPLPERARLSMDPLNGLSRDAGAMIIQECKDTVIDWYTLYFGVFNGAGKALVSHQNTANDNDSMDYIERLVVRILGKQGAFFRDNEAGTLELGFSRMDGEQGETIVDDDSATAFGYSRSTWHYAMGVEAEYHFKFKEFGELWLMGEWFEGTTARPTDGLLSGNVGTATDHIAKMHGWYTMIGYRVGGTNNKYVDNLEGVFRYEQWSDVPVPGIGHPNKADVFSTRIYTFGINYYIKGHNAKLQAAYSWVDDPNQDDHHHLHGLREARNDTFVLSVQVMF